MLRWGERLTEKLFDDDWKPETQQWIWFAIIVAVVVFIILWSI